MQLSVENPPIAVAGSTFMVYGLGASGRAAARLLLARGAFVLAVDDGGVSRQQLGDLADHEAFELLGQEAVESELPQKLDWLVLSPGVRLDRPIVRRARAAGVPVIGEPELAFSLLEGEVVAITGSNGKSTTTAMTGALLGAAGHQVELCGNIGEPLSAKLEGPPGRVFVVELSSFQLESVDRFRPRVGALLNLAPDHLDRHGGFDTYAEIKARIFRRQRTGDVAVLNADDPRVAETATPTGVRRRYFSRLGPVEDGCFVVQDRVLEAAPGSDSAELFGIQDVLLPGPHNLENAMAAALITTSLDGERRSMSSALRSFKGLAHRLQQVRELGGVTFFDDSKGTNVAATRRSLEGFGDGTVHLILGGRNKDADLGELAAVVEKKTKAVYLIGEAARVLESALASKSQCLQCATLDRAVLRAAERASAGEVVLLSPACASFDQFDDFAARGRAFQRLVRDLPARGPSALHENDGSSRRECG